MIFILTIYGFFFWVIGSVFGGLTTGNWISMYICIGAGGIFYFFLLISYYRKQQLIYKLAGKSEWIDNIIFVNDKGYLIAGTHRVKEKIPLSASIDMVKSILKNPSILRIRAALLQDKADLASIKIDGTPKYDQEESFLNEIKAVTQQKIIKKMGYDDYRKFSFEYFMVENIVKPNGYYTCLCSRKPVSIYDASVNRKNLLRQVRTEMEKKIMEESTDAEKDLEEHKKSMSKLKKEIESEIDKELMIGKDDIEDNIDEEIDSFMDDEEYDDDTPEEKIGSHVPVSELGYDDEEDYMENLEDYEKIDVSQISNMIGEFTVVIEKDIELANRGKSITRKLKDLVTNYLYKKLDTNDILRTLRKYRIFTIKDLHECNKTVVGKSLGFTHDEMKEFVQFVEGEVDKMEIKWFEDLLPDEISLFTAIKMVKAKTLIPRHDLTLVTYAEPIEIYMPKKVLAKPYMNVNPYEAGDKEGDNIKKRRFEQAVIETPTRFQDSIKFLPNGYATLDGYPVSVPMAYATFVLKGWITTGIPLLKQIASQDQIEAEFEDYKHMLSTQSTYIMALTAYINHVMANTKLQDSQIETDKAELNALDAKISRMNQIQLKELYRNSGGYTPMLINDMLSNDAYQDEEMQPSTGSGKGIGIAISVIVSVIIILIIVVFTV
jgi:hypothetical protein